MLNRKSFLLIRLTVTFLCFIVTGSAHAQSTAGITHLADTSYSTWSAYTNTLKTHPNIKIVGLVNNPSVTIKKDILYCQSGDRNLLLDAFYPKASAALRRTAIVFIHGGGWRTGNRTQHYPLAQKLAAMGYVCFTPEYRLSTEALYPAGVYDCKAAIQWVRANAAAFAIDTNKIVVAGFSAGGELAAFLGATAAEPGWNNTNCNKLFTPRVNAVIDIDGTLSFVHPAAHEGIDSPHVSAATYSFGYSKKENRPLWEDASPLAHAAHATAPFLFINSSVPWMHAGREEFIAILKQRHIYTEVQSFDNAPHSFCLFDPWFSPTVQYMDGFLKKVLR